MAELERSAALPRFTREEVSRHNKREDCWVIIHGEVYNVTSWLSKHPGGSQLLLNHAGEDTSVAWTSFHPNKELVSKYMVSYHIGSLVEEQREHPSITKDFLKLRAELEEGGKFEPDMLFFLLTFAITVLLEVVAWWMLYFLGNTWITWTVSGTLFAVGQIQLGALQHDLSHRSIFRNKKISRFFHDINLGLLQGVSINWWDRRHFRHHAKPNVLEKDPDITIPLNFFLLGKSMPKEWGEKQWGIFPYNFQHLYFIFTGPTFGLTLFFPVEFILQAFYYGMWEQLLLMCGFFAWFYLAFSPLLGGVLGTVSWFFFMRFMMSQMYVWVTQINHLPMDIDQEQNLDWVRMQLRGTCDIEPSIFMDWFSGHLTYQIEHHLFPTMPRSSYKSVKPRVMELCRKHGVVYMELTLWQGISGLLRSLKQSGELWKKTWEAQNHKLG